MKLVEAEITHDEDDVDEGVARPPRPARRRVYTSLLLTSSVLIGTVVLVYSVFPPRNNEVMTSTVEAHRSPGKVALEAPTPSEVSAWAMGIFSEAAPWPEDARLQPVAAYRLEILHRPVALVRYKFPGGDISVAMMRKRDAVALTRRRQDDGLSIVSWPRSVRFTCVVVGPTESKDAWMDAVGAPD
jgi:hypothetical protein